MKNDIYQRKKIDLIKEAIKEGYKLAESQSKFSKGLKIKDEITEGAANSFCKSISDCKEKYPLSDEFINDSAKFMGFLIRKYDEWA